jgi:hypothetical protein
MAVINPTANAKPDTPPSTEDTATPTPQPISLSDTLNGPGEHVITAMSKVGMTLKRIKKSGLNIMITIPL